MSKPPPGDNFDDTTPTDLVARLPNSPERVSFGTIESALIATTTNLGALRERWDRASDVERRALAQRLAPELRALGDNAHDLARWMEEYAVGAA